MSAADTARQPATQPTRTEITVRDLEVTAPTEPIAATTSDGHRVVRVWLLVRLCTEPLGFVTLDVPDCGLTAEAIDQAVEDSFGERLRVRRGLPDLQLRRAEILRNAPAITVVVCTRERPEALRRCLDSLLTQEYPGFRILVVDNAPTTGATKNVVDTLRVPAAEDGERTSPTIDYLLVSEPGLSIARNRAVAHAPGEILVWIDDDEVADRHWLAELARAFADNPEADVVGGVVVPAELSTPAQVWFEQFGGHSKGRGFTPAVFSPATSRQQSPLYPLPPFATGANMAFRPGVIERIGGFDPALGAGTPAMGSEDTLAFTRILLEGGTIVYQPTAITRHYHRRDLEGLRRQMVGYGLGLTAGYTSLILHRPGVIPKLLALIPCALRAITASDSMRVATIEDDFPKELLRANRRAMMRGPLAYLRGAACPARRSRASPRWLPTASGAFALSCLGVLLIAYAYAAGRLVLPAKTPAYWVGQILVFAPPTAKLLAWARLGKRPDSAGDAKPLALVLGLTVNQYLLKVFYSPDQFRFPDELQHWAATTALLNSGRLFEPTSALPVAGYFPGLEEMGAAVAALTGLSVTSAGLLIAGVAHLVFVGLVFLMVREACQDATLAAMACALYSTAGHYLFFDSMYLYQTAALPFLVLALWAFGRGGWGGGCPRWSYCVLGVVSVAVVTVSHHITAMATAGCLLMVGLCQVVRNRPRWRWRAMLPGLVAVIFVLTWFFVVSSDLLPYLRTPAQATIRAVLQAVGDLVHGSSESFTTPLPDNPWWEILVQILGMLALLAFLARGLHQATRERLVWPLWHRAVLLGSCAYFCGVGLRFLGKQGPELAGRASTFTYLPLSILVAGSLVTWSRHRSSRTGARRAVALGTLLATLLLLAGRAGGWPPYWGRLPGEYLVSAFERSIDGEGVAAAWWIRAQLEPGSRVAADSTGLTLVSTYGDKDPVREAGSLFQGLAWSQGDTEQVRRLAVTLIWVDTRLSDQIPRSGEYYPFDPQAYQHTSPLDPATLTKLDAVAGASRVYDSGAIRLYDVRSL